MNYIFVLLLFSHYFVDNGTAEQEKYIRTLHGYQDPAFATKKTFVVNRDFESEDHNVAKRQAPPSPVDEKTVIPKMNYLNDTHKQLMVHWVGEGSNVIICLARDPSSTVFATPTLPSAVYISYDYGDSYKNKTDQFKMQDGKFATLEKFYNHPKYNTHFVFTDIKNNYLFVTTNLGTDFKAIQLSFTPSEISFHELQPSIFVVHDKNRTDRLYITEDFGTSFRKAQDFVKSFHWIKESDYRQRLVIQRKEPNSLTTIFHSADLFSSQTSSIYATDVNELFVKDDYLFTTKTNSKGVLELYVSYKLGKPTKCIFDTQLDVKSHYIVDVTSNRALVALSHSATNSHLYVSENLDNTSKAIKFTLSLEDVLCYFPNSTWHDSWIHHVAEDAFADVYKVEGLTGIYIASRVLLKPMSSNLGPQYLGSVITFDHGRSWRLLKAPDYDAEGQRQYCSVNNNCSLHLSQKFSQLHPDTKSISILSSKSAPGILIASGVVGKSLKGHYGVYISHDAGLTWSHTLRDLYFFMMGDHGGLLSAVKYYRPRGDTRYILYSTDMGENWEQAAFHNEEIRLYGLMTEPGENTTIFTMFGSLPQEHHWIIVKLDLIKAFKYNCTKDDYKLWSPSQSEENRSYVPCVLGQQLTFKRRMPHANCYNGADFDAPISMAPCECDVYDYECDFGFIHDKVGNCIRNETVLIDPYQIPSTCQPGTFYKRTKGYRKIQGDQCVNGFKNHYLPEEIPCPFKEVPDFLLFAQRERISRLNLVTKTLEEVPVKNLKNVIAIDFDMKNNCVYWADIAADNIGRQCLSNNSAPEILVSSDLASVEGMAFDWISNNLYFVDGMRSKIELIRTDISHSGRMRRTVLGPEALKKPRGIALHPRSGYMFWTDWSVENPSVNRANLDGSNISKLFGKPRVEWPNGITVDYIAERIYWVDARKDYIASSDLHGDYYKLIVSHEEVVSHPFAIAVFKNNMYWDDWKRSAIYSADKDTFSGVEALQNKLIGLMDLKIYAHGLQVGTNACVNNKGCAFVCVGAPKNGRVASCLCPDGMLSSPQGKCLCPGNVEPFANLTCPPIRKSCSPEHFTCGNGLCVPRGWRCDGDDDCGDGSDENQCGPQTCPSSFFVCGDGKCLPQYWKCDYDVDCLDGSDEINCPRQNCTDGQFACANGKCIASKWRCDKENDCKDNSDELNCEPEEPSSCKSDEFHCTSGGTACIPNTWRCDGGSDCADNSDELNCSNFTCPSPQFSCGPPSGKCISPQWMCDGEADCPGGADEKNCSTISPLVPEINDDFNPKKNGLCQSWMYRCLNKKCIPHWWKCDGANDCEDGSDELGCDSVLPTTTLEPPTGPPIYPPPHVCDHNQYLCPSSGDCIFSSWVCDGMPDCSDGEDERNCHGTLQCPSGQFKCRMDGSCIPLSKVCNQVYDCPDASDELLCEHNFPSRPATPSCSVGYFPCDGSECYPLSALCDHRPDCKDGYDEENCNNTSRVYQAAQMGVDLRDLEDTSLLFYWWVQQSDEPLEFKPSINQLGENNWINQTWTRNYDYKFIGLQPYTQYNITVYVRLVGSKVEFPPAEFYVTRTAEGIPTEPWNITAKQKNGSHVLVSWNKPIHGNGQITNYQICWYPPLPPIKLKLSGNETSHLLAADFQRNVTYSFYVIAFNNRHESPSSVITNMTFDADSTLVQTQNVTVVQITDNSISLEWKYSKQFDSFTITISTMEPYPLILPRTTNTTSILIDKLSPSVQYTFQINAVRKSFIGPPYKFIATTTGTQLPDISDIHWKVPKDIGTSVKLSWDSPNGKKADWVYGVYYGINEKQLIEKARLETTNLTATVNNLDACEFYTFSVGVVGPLGCGPLSRTPAEVQTSPNKKAPPKKLTVSEENGNPLKIRVQWSPSCPTVKDPVTYIIRVHEMTNDIIWTIRKTNATDLYHIFNITYGGIYEISVATDEPDALYSSNVTFMGPPILPPYGVNTMVENNGSYVVYWQERANPKMMDAFNYEILVSDGNDLNMRALQRFVVSKPPFIYTNTTSNMYTFAVRILTSAGYMSAMSERISKESTPVPITSSNLTLILCLVGLVFVAIIVIAVFVVKHRRLQNTFTRFASSHYDSRSGAATFDDNGLEEDDSPQIRGFSDDEPLVIA